jgi:hypothetical protein
MRYFDIKTFFITEKDQANILIDKLVILRLSPDRRGKRMPPYKCPKCGRVYQTHDFCNHHRTSVLCDDIGPFDVQKSGESNTKNYLNYWGDLIGKILIFLFICYLIFITLGLINHVVDLKSYFFGLKSYFGI